ADPGPQRSRNGSGGRGRARGRRAQRGLRAAAPAARTDRPVRRLARHARPGPRRTRHEPNRRTARRQGQRPALRPPHARRGRDRPALQPAHAPAAGKAGHGADAARTEHRALSPAAARRAATRTVLKGAQAVPPTVSPSMRSVGWPTPTGTLWPSLPQVPTPGSRRMSLPIILTLVSTSGPLGRASYREQVWIMA